MWTSKVFGPAQKALADPSGDSFNAMVGGLIAVGVLVGICISIRKDTSQSAALASRGLPLDFLRDGSCAWPASAPP